MSFVESNDSASRAQGQALRELSRALASTRTGISSVEPSTTLSRSAEAQKLGIPSDLLDTLIRLFRNQPANLAAPRYDHLVGSPAPSSPVSMPSPATPNQMGSPVSGTAPSTSLVPQQALVPLNLTNEQIMNFLTSQGVGGKEQLALERVNTPATNVEQATVNSYPVPVVPQVANGNLDSSVTG